MENMNRQAKIQQVASKLDVPLEAVIRWDKNNRIMHGDEQVGFFLPPTGEEGHEIVNIEYDEPLPEGIVKLKA